MSKENMGSSRCGAMGLAASLQCQDTGWIPGPAQWLKDLALPQLGCTCGSDLIPGSGTPMPWGGGAKKERKKKGKVWLNVIQLLKSIKQYVSVNSKHKLKKEYMVCMYNGILFSLKKEEILPFVTTWMKNIKLSEKS